MLFPQAATSLNGLEPEAVVRRCSIEKEFLEISQNSQENTCARVSFITKLQVEACKQLSGGKYFFCYGSTKAATGGVLQEKMLLEISQNSQENTCASASF